MPQFSAHPITVDGVALDGWAWGVTAKVKTRPALRPADVQISGVDGLTPSLDDDFAESLVTLTMYVRGSDEDGYVPPGAAALAQCKANLDTLLAVFSKTYALLDIQENADGVGGLRRIYGKVIQPIEPDLKAGALAELKVQVMAPFSFWEDLEPADWTQTAVTSGSVYEVTTLQGSTAPISDAVFLFTGPGTNVELSDFNTHDYCRLNYALAAGQSWRMNSATWASQYGTLTLGSADTVGTSADAITVEGGGSARFLRLTPVLDLVSGLRKVRVSVTGSGFTSASTLKIRARRKYVG